MSEKMKKMIDKVADTMEEAYDVAEAVTVNSYKAVKNAVKTTLDKMTNDKK